MKKIYILSVFLILYSYTFSQTVNDSWKLYPSKDSASAVVTTVDSLMVDSLVSEAPVDTVFDITPSTTPGNVKINKDARIDGLSKKLGTPTDGTTVKVRGYRLQLIASNKKSVIDGERAKFIMLKNDVTTYTDYVQPNYKLRVGDFKTKLEAQKLQNEVKATFPSALVVNDLIELSKIK